MINIARLLNKLVVGAASWVTLWEYLPQEMRDQCWNTLAAAHTAVANLIHWVA
ncbi:MAG: hypothetical protein AAF439_10380 [Pseudomonadota bacterium]